MNEQIENQAIVEMAKEITDVWDNQCQFVSCNGCKYNNLNDNRCQEKLIADRLISKGYRKQEWISVEDRMPETNRDCLLLLDTEEIVIGYCRRNLHAFVEGGIVLVKDVTHWMPLPEPPKMKGGAE